MLDEAEMPELLWCTGEEVSKGLVRGQGDWTVGVDLSRKTWSSALVTESPQL